MAEQAPIRKDEEKAADRVKILARKFLGNDLPKRDVRSGG
jgi:hypothetical protein